jgi:hypothetical protein
MNNNNNNNNNNQSLDENPFATSSSSIPPPPPQQNPGTTTENWGTHMMGAPAVPSSHPDNKKAALQTPSAHEQQPQVQYYQQDHPYVQHSPVQKPSNSPMESILHMFDSWSKKAEATANNIWHNRKFLLFIPLHLTSFQTSN